MSMWAARLAEGAFDELEPQGRLNGEKGTCYFLVDMGLLGA
jgi:hypothetical protein